MFPDPGAGETGDAQAIKRTSPVFVTRKRGNATTIPQASFTSDLLRSDSRRLAIYLKVLNRRQ